MSRTADVTCLGCGCLCDDLTVRVENGRVVAITPECPMGLSWFRYFTAMGSAPGSRIDGREVSLDEAIAEAAARLSRARAPLVLGLSGSTIEAQREAVAIADRIGAVIDVAHAADVEPVLAAFQNVGAVGATLGEVKNRADVVLYWNVDPMMSHPRHAERYAVAPEGRFVDGGRAGRTVIVVVDESTTVGLVADEVLRVPASGLTTCLRVLSALVRGVPVEPSEVEQACGVPLEAIARLAERMRAARYGAFFYGPTRGRSGGAAAVEAALRLVRDLNMFTHFAALTMGGPGNPAGAEAVLTWQTGFPHAVDLGSGVPRYRPGDTTAESRLRRGLCDAALLVGYGATDGLSTEAQAALEGIPVVEIAPNASRGVAIDTAPMGVATSGTVMRCDGIPIPIRPVIATDRPEEAAVLRRLREAIEVTEAAR